MGHSDEYGHLNEAWFAMSGALTSISSYIALQINLVVCLGHVHHLTIIDVRGRDKIILRKVSEFRRVEGEPVEWFFTRTIEPGLVLRIR
jgi:hypothetical protein